MTNNGCGTDAHMNHQVSPAVTQCCSGEMGMAGRVIRQYGQFCGGVPLAMCGRFGRLFQHGRDQCDRFHVHPIFG